MPIHHGPSAEDRLSEPTIAELCERHPHATAEQVAWLTRRFQGNTRKVINMLVLGATRPSVLFLPHQHVAHDRPQGGNASIDAFFNEQRSSDFSKKPAMSFAIASIHQRLGERVKHLGDTNRLFAFAMDPDMELSNCS